MKLTKKDLSDLFKELDIAQKRHFEIQREKEKVLKSNLKHLNLKAKQLNKLIPDELLVFVINGQPTGMWFFEKYKEWLE